MDKAMTYSIFDNGNLVVSFDREDEAHAALERIVRDDAAARDRIVLFAFDDDGNVVDDCVPGQRIAHFA